MNIFGVLLFILAVHRSSTELHWDFGEWIPIPGKCATCEKGRIFSLEQESGRSSGNIFSEDHKRKKKAFSTGNVRLVTPADVFSLQQKSFVEEDPDRVQLIYLPEGSINDLRTARVAKVKDVDRVLIRPARETSFSARSLAIPDLEAVPSTISFREISPRRPTALVAEKGKEREAHEQIQLLEAALNAHPNDVREGELPRVFIAPTHLPPPPGYVKIPLLPSQSHVGSKKTLPRTFLTSEHQNHLPPGFVQVPLPERVSQLSHSIPFVNPETNPHFLSHINQQGRQRDQPRVAAQVPNVRQPELEFSRPPQHFNILQPIQDGFNLAQPVPQQRPQQIAQQVDQQRPQQIEQQGPQQIAQHRPQHITHQRPQQTAQQRPQQNINTEQPPQHNFDVSQIVQNHFNIRQPINNIRKPINQNFNPQPFNQNFNIQPVNHNFNPQPNDQNFNRDASHVQGIEKGQAVQGQQNNLNVNQPPQQEFLGEQPVDQPIQLTVQHRPSQLNVNFNDNQQNSQVPVSHVDSLDNAQDTLLIENQNRNINRGRGRERSRQQNLRSQLDSNPTPQGRVSQTNLPSSNTKPSSSFFEIGSSVIKPQNDFDYTFTVPEFNPANDYEQDFAAYDQEFEFPNNKDTRKQDIHTPENIIQPETTTPASSDDNLSSVHSENLNTDNPRNIPFQLSPRPIHVVPTLSPSPIEPKSIEPHEIIAEDFTLQDSTSAKPTSIQLFPKLVSEKETSEHDASNLSLRPNTRNRLRENNFRGRSPNISSRHRLNLSPQKVEENLDVEIGTPVVTKELAKGLLSDNQLSVTSPPTLARVRGSLNNRRRRPLRKESTVQEDQDPITTTASTTTASTTTASTTTITVAPVISSSSTLFPPFSVAKRLNEKSESTQSAQENRGGNLSGLRGRFGSRIRSRIHEAGENSKVVVNEPEAALNTEEGPVPIRARGQGQRRRRIRGRNGNGNPTGQRRRRVLNRVRKINPGSSDNLNNQIQSEDQLRGAESARVLFSHVPLNKIPDPISKTLELINVEKTDDSQSANENNEYSEIQTTSSSILSEVAISPDNNLNILNLIPSGKDNVEETTIEDIRVIDPSSANIEIISLGEDTEGYVNNNESFSEHEPSLDEHSPNVVSVDAQDLPHDSISDDVTVSAQPEVVTSPFDSLISSISHVSNDENIFNPTTLQSDDTHVDVDNYSFLREQVSQNEHSIPQSTLFNEGKLTLINDNAGTFLSENETSPQDNYYDDYDNERADPNTGTFLGSSAHVVYAVALSEAPPDIIEHDFTTQQTAYEESLPKDVDDKEELQLPTLVEVENIVDEFTTTEKSESSDSEQINAETITSTSESKSESKTENQPTLIENFNSNLTTATPINHSHENAVHGANLIHETKNIITTSPSEELSSVNENSEFASQHDAFSLDENTLSEQEAIAIETTTSTSQFTSEFLSENSSSALKVTEAHTETNPNLTPENSYSPSEASPLDEYDYEYFGEVRETSTTSGINTPYESKDQSQTIDEDLTEPASQNHNNNLTESFLDTFFSPNRESKENTITIDDQTHKIIGKSTITEVRSSAPVICIDGKCVIGSGLKKR